jgi:hypothetical protein
VVVGSLEDIEAANAAGLKLAPHCESLEQIAEQLIFGDKIDLERGFRILMRMAASYPCYESTETPWPDAKYKGCDDPRVVVNVLLERYGTEAIRDHLAQQTKP